MIKIGYFNEVRLHIDDYNPAIHEGGVKCDEGHILIAKKGDTRTHHFCHRAGDISNCSSKSKTDWHLWWQGRILSKNIEFRFNKTTRVANSDGSVREEKLLKIADSINIIGSNKDILSIVEFQNSKMELEEFQTREKFYTRRDLMSQWGLDDCTATLTWVFNLKDCDIEIDHIFGNVVCFRWMKGTKYMLNAKARTFYDNGKRQLLEVYAIHKPKIIETRFIAVVWTLEEFDRVFFEGITNTDLSVDQKRLNVHPIINNCIPIIDDRKRGEVIEMCKALYFKGSDSKTKQKSKKNTASVNKYTNITEKQIKDFLN